MLNKAIKEMKLSDTKIYTPWLQRKYFNIKDSDFWKKKKKIKTERYRFDEKFRKITKKWHNERKK